MATTTGVFPCYENQFWINTDKTGTKELWEHILDCETFEVKFDNGVEEWTPFESEGWVRRLMTAKNISITVSGKRNTTVPETPEGAVGGNNFVAGLAFSNGRNAEADFKWLFADGTEVVFEGSPINVTSLEAGASTNVAPLEFEVLSNGKPKINGSDSY